MVTPRVPEIRIRSCNTLPVRQDGGFVLYWMIAFRRTTWNCALDRALEWAEDLRKPLVILEALRCDYPWASDRIHSFVIEGMADRARRLHDTRVLYYPFVERERNAGKGLLQAMAAHACVIITDDFPCFFLPRMVAAAASRVSVKMEAVDSNGLLPLRAADRVFSTAHSFRRFLQRELPRHVMVWPQPDPIAKAAVPAMQRIPSEISSRWPKTPLDLLNGGLNFATKLPIDHKVTAVNVKGGSTSAQLLLKDFLRNKLNFYLEQRNQPETNAVSGLSPYLHFGHISSHQVFARVIRREAWSPANLSLRSGGSRAGWWNMSPAAEAFLDQIVTWRELGFNFCHLREDYDRLESLPAWAQSTLRKHARDKRPHLYALEQFENARTHDPLWNAAQRQLLAEGRIHNYLRMLWEKKVLEWSPTPSVALETMLELNNKYALDGRDPNSYSGILWCLGRYDRPWGPERAVFGTVRYMSSANAIRKLKLQEYLARYGTAITEAG